MKKALIGEKIGMTQFIQEDGTVIPVTICRLGPCVVVQKKTRETDGYTAVKLGYGETREKRLAKSVSADLKKKNILPKRILKEFRNYDDSMEIGAEVNCAIFEENDTVTVTSTSKGHGFAGVIKRHNFSGGRKTHGSHFHRAPGSIGACAYPGEVWKGQKMPGRYGGKNVTVKNLKIVKVLEDKNLVLISGSVPGTRNSIITVKQA